MRTVLLLVLVCVLASARARADGPKAPSLEDRAKILRTELRRGPAADLAPYLAPDADPTLRRLSIRALGRIGDRAGATEWLLKLLGGGDPHLVDVLHAAALSGARAFLGPVAHYLDDKNPAVAAAALEALGWIGANAVEQAEPGEFVESAVIAAARAASKLHAKEPSVRAAALDALGRCRQDGYLERVLGVARADSNLRAEASFAAWLLARVRKTAAKTADPAWMGTAGLGDHVVGALTMPGADGFLNLIRPFGLLADEAAYKRFPPFDFSDPRVMQEYVSRVLAPRKGPDVDQALASHLGEADPKSRQAAAEALGEHATREAFAALAARGRVETDDRVREAICGAMVHAAGPEDEREPLPLPRMTAATPNDRLWTLARIYSHSKNPKTLLEQVALARKHLDLPLVLLTVLGALDDVKAAEVTAFVGECLTHADPYVRAAAVGLVGKQQMREHLPALDAVLEKAQSHAERDVRQAVVEAWAEFVKGAKADKPEDEPLLALKARLLEAAKSDPAFTARASARKACRELHIDGAPAEDPLQPNDWQGLPRPKQTLLGLDLTKGGQWLDEAEILQLADRMAEEKPEFVVENQVGEAKMPFRLAIDPSEAPVHAVSFLLAATSGVFDGTTWHRVVPSFVIQGGDPHGDGSGDAGWSVPDEITRASFVRGALGMPKGDVRDTGGCQLFVMHSHYRPLDGRYTCYGHVVDGMDAVDTIRVGDRVTGVRMVLPEKAPGAGAAK